MSHAELSPMVQALWDKIHHYEPHAEFGGSLPGPGSGVHSYHQAWVDVPHDQGYSVHYYGDRVKWVQPNGGRFAAALDITLPTPELMARYTARLHRFAITHSGAALRFGLREFAGSVDGVNVLAWDLTTHQRTYGWDKSHLWHIHLSFNRRFVNSQRILPLSNLFRP